ncbi:MAG: glycoside hydrolase family 5 protein [Treponema sp.]|nr:glycoside hydrolase family 5 protein [Treponema sp.]
MRKIICKTLFALALAFFLFPSCANAASSNKASSDFFNNEKLYSTSNLVIDNGSKPFGSSTAAQIVDSMKFGWNLGNTLDAFSGGNEKNGWNGRNASLGLKTETCWGMPKTTKEMIAGIKEKGFSAIRIPVSWHDHIDSKYTIDSAWMSRVKEIVDWSIGEGLYVIINIHHDNITPSTCTANGHKGYSPASSCINESKRYLYNVWSQIVLAFNNGYDERLIFETINEPRLPGDKHEWNWEAGCSSCKDAAKCINELNQLCLDTIRESGGNNAKRLVMVPAYVASPGAALNKAFVMPKDSASGMLALSVHMYSPYNFAMESPGSKKFTDAHKGDLDYWLGQLNTNFVKKGIPVVIGEMGATNKNNDAERAKWFVYYLGKVKSYKMAACLWDNGQWKVPSSGSFNELFGYYNRSAQTWYFDDLITKAIQARN